jgi:uncharacterized protein YndB with AHSA1/START domain
MDDQSYTTSFTVDQSPDEVFAAISNVRAWWAGEIDGNTERLGSEFTYRYQDAHWSKQRITESVPGRRIVWHVVDGELSFVAKKDEWRDTDIVFDIVRKGAQTELRFTHVGLIPTRECFDSCTDAWRFLVNQSLRSLITTGEGQTPDW